MKQKQKSQRNRKKGSAKMILITDKENSYGKVISEMLYYMGILSEYEPSYKQSIFSEEKYSAVLIIDSDTLSESEVMATKEKFRDAGIFLITNEIHSRKDMYSYSAAHLPFDGIIPASASPLEIVNSLKNPNIGSYIIGELDASVSRGGIYLGKKKISFTKTETMIARSIMFAHPGGLYARSILALAFRQSKTPDISNIRTHISVMNKKFRFLTGINLICTTENGQYVITKEISDGVSKAKNKTPILIG